MSSQNPLVSIVFTSYNHKEFLKQALDSIVNQTYSNIEIIVVDDCSTDGSQEILLQYKHLPNINLILSETNSGSYVNSTNLGATYAKGEYILFAQCDDFAVSVQVEKLVEAMQNNPNVGVVYSKSNLVDEHGVKFLDDFKGRESQFKKHIKKTFFIEGSKMKDFLCFACVIPNLSAALIRLDLYKKVNGLSKKYLVVADWEFWLDLTEVTNFYYLPEPLNNFRQHGTTIRSSVKIKTQISEIFAMFYNHIAQYSLQSATKKKMQVGAGAVWFAYFFENKKLWFQSLTQTYKELNSKYDSVLVSLILGFKKHCIEFFIRKFVKIS